MQAFNRTFLISGMSCLVIMSKENPQLLGREVKLIRRHFTTKDHSDVGYWETKPTLRGRVKGGETGSLMWHPTALLALDEPKLRNQLILERRIDCSSDLRMASYIFGRKISP